MLSKIQIQEMKAKAIKILFFSRKDYLIETLTKHEDLVDARKTLKDKYEIEISL